MSVIVCAGERRSCTIRENNYENTMNQLKQLQLWYVEEYMIYTGQNIEQQILASKC